MADLPTDSRVSRLAWIATMLGTLVLGAPLLGGSLLLGGEPAATWPAEPAATFPGEPATLPAEEPVVDLRITGNTTVPEEKILRQIHTRVGRPFDLDVIQDDVRRLNQMGAFVDVRPFSQQVAGGRAVVFQVVERPVLDSVSYVGNKAIRKSVIDKESGLKAGDAQDPYAVQEARRKIEQLYHTRGFSKARVSVWEGDKTGDRRAVFVINEGQKQRVLWTQFVGNTIADDARLRTQIQSKPGILWFIKGEVDLQQIDEDLKRLKAYYSSLGYARARIGRELDFTEGGEWLTLTFVIDEGPRFRVRDISFIGNQKYSSDELASELKLRGGEYFDQRRMTADLTALQDKYGGDGYIFADVQPEMRWLEDQAEFNVVYNINEGDRYRVGRINVEIEGENPHTQITTVLNRLSLEPGDIVDIRKLRDSERRLRRSGLFEIDPAKGNAPRIVFSPPEFDADDESPQVARPPQRNPNVRGQSPDLVPSGPWRVTPAAGSQPGDGRVDLTLPCRRVDLSFAQNAEPQYSNAPAPGVAPAAPPRSPVVVRAQYTPEGGYAVPTLQPRLPLIGSQRPPAAYTSASPAVQYSAPPSTIPAYASGSANLAEPLPPGATGRPYYDPSYAPSAGPALPYIDSTPPSQLPAGEGIFADEVPFYARSEEERTRSIDIFPRLHETQTGRFMLGAGVNSDLGVVGSMVIDEQNFDWTRFPRSWEDIRNATAFRGAGQRFRLELVPGTEVQRYMVNFQEPYLLNSNISLGLSGFYYDRRYYEWDEQRIGGRASLGYQFTHDLSGSVAFRGEKVTVHNPAVPFGAGVPELDEALGDNALYGFSGQLSHDTRDSTFLATEGHLIEMSFEQVIGSFSYPRVEVDMRKYFLMHERPDGSGRHVLSLSGQFGWTGSDTPIYDHYFAGGFSTLRGFNFRSVSPRNPLWGIAVGGEVQLLASIQYLFPITADDMLRGVVFCDTGTVERTIDDWQDKYRIAPGLGLRITIPAMGPAPIALDFAFPVSSQPGDDEEVFSFFVGFNH